MVSVLRSVGIELRARKLIALKSAASKWSCDLGTLEFEVENF